MRPSWEVFAAAIGVITIFYFILAYSLWELLPPYRRLRRRRIEAELGEELAEDERLLEEARLPNGEGRLVWFGLTDRRLLALRRRARSRPRVEVLEEIDLNTVSGLGERALPFSFGMILGGAGLGGLGVLLTWKFGNLWVLLLIFGALVFAGGFIRIHYYDLMYDNRPLPFWSFSSQGPGRFHARRFAKSLNHQLSRSRPR